MGKFVQSFTLNLAMISLDLLGVCFLHSYVNLFLRSLLFVDDLDGSVLRTGGGLPLFLED